jgi:hypothetical protein
MYTDEQFLDIGRDMRNGEHVSDIARAHYMKWVASRAEPNPNDGYSHEQWDLLLTATYTQMMDLARTKGSEYAHGADRLDNFRRAAKEFDIPMELVWRIYASKHWDSITTYIRDLVKGTDRQRSEPISGRIDDLLVYLLLLKAMVEERGE